MMEAPTFTESLNAAVTLTAAGSSAGVDGGNVKQLQVDCQLFGFKGMVRIWVIAEGGGDELFSLVTGSDLLEIEVTVQKALYNISPIPEPQQLKGIVTHRRLREVPSPDLEGNTVLYREYTLQFCDAAAALWTHHHPCTVYAKTTLEKVIGEHTPQNINTKLGWTALKANRGIICLGLGVDYASFYDFLFWLSDVEAGHIWYDYTAQQLVFSDQKPTGTSNELVPGTIDDMLQVEVDFAVLPRFAPKINNSRDGATKLHDVTQPDAIDGVRWDHLVHTAINKDAQARQTTEEQRSAPGRYDVTVACNVYPEMYIAPGNMLELGNEFSDKLLLSGETLRVLSWRLAANATNQVPEFDIENNVTEYEVQCTFTLEPEDDGRWRGPSYRAPRYPLEVEGKVLSAIGIDGDRSYTVYDADNAYGAYKVKFDLWNSTITIPVWPDFVPGHLYFPIPKDSRVLMSLEFDSARISRFLEWGKDVTLPNASQGNHLLLGRNATSETSIKHWYVDTAPQLVIGRINASDQGTVTLEEGVLTLEITDSGSAGALGATVSVEPQAQMAKAESEQATELAVSDVQQSAQSSSEELSSTAEEAATTLRTQVQDAKKSVDTEADKLSGALAGVSADIDGEIDRLEQVGNETRQKINKLLE